MALAKELHPDRPDGSEERFKAVSKAYALLSDPDRREAYDSGDELDAGGDGAGSDLHALGEWRVVKMPFTAFRDRTFYDWDEKVGHLYVLLRDEESGPFALELGGIAMGRCENGCLPAAGFHGKVGCEMGHCQCGYYNGLRCEGFDGPISGTPSAPAFERGYALHHGDF